MSAVTAAPPAAAPRLRVRRLSVSFGPVTAVRSVDFRVAAGEVVAILGANGAGKTTLLSTIAGHVTPSEGSIELSGVPAANTAHRRAREGLAFVGDDRHLFPSLTVQQNLRLVPGSLEIALQRFPALQPLMGRPARLLSGGEQQMLALARCMGTRPSLIVVDELSLGLAPRVRDDLLRSLRTLADEGAAVLIVEQHIGSALAVADRAVILRRGEIADERPAAAWSREREKLTGLILS